MREGVEGVRRSRRSEVVGERERAAVLFRNEGLQLLDDLAEADDLGLRLVERRLKQTVPARDSKRGTSGRGSRKGKRLRIELDARGLAVEPDAVLTSNLARDARHRPRALRAREREEVSSRRRKTSRARSGRTFILRLRHCEHGPKQESVRATAVLEKRGEPTHPLTRLVPHVAVDAALGLAQDALDFGHRVEVAAEVGVRCFEGEGGELDRRGETKEEERRGASKRRRRGDDGGTSSWPAGGRGSVRRPSSLERRDPDRARAEMAAAITAERERARSVVPARPAAATTRRSDDRALETVGPAGCLLSRLVRVIGARATAGSSARSAKSAGGGAGRRSEEEEDKRSGSSSSVVHAAPESRV